MNVLLLDNFDSFTYNLFHYCEEIGAKVDVIRNNEIDLASVEKYDKIILSPGPHLPKDAGKLMELIAMYYDKKPMLGVCLGMQALAEFFGGELYNLDRVNHGVEDQCVQIMPNQLFKEVPEEFKVGLYHSWAVKRPLPKGLNITALSQSDVLMAFEHEKLPIYAVQFHPESVMTPEGKIIMKNFLSL
ncbi:aminodeoxychorismate/anthranilate synthase component II [Lishizhenia sp.]|uniref:anthranilate synthase component II n=1 Tax=Lishizhenia sp. TaxID=2497594 RepID=UPI00299DA152|nr:aminodeoxychorismate/anthranilate synthase component II [Lishizhenia sp.]MDX1446462.1 aminodeoxychorismate/anthranilate synthase component II [Lishizhenia sp.]